MMMRNHIGTDALQEACARLSENLASYDDEVASELSSGGERADLWSEIDVNVEDIRTLLDVFSRPTVLTVVSEALSEATDVLKAVHDWQAGSEILPIDLWTQIRDILRKAGRI